MSTITTKQLRENMPQVVRDLQKGKPIQLSYRHKIIGVLQPAQAIATPLRRGSFTAIQSFLESADFGPIPIDLQTPSLNIKQQIAKLRTHDLDSK
jgi:antitoxin (DNA-binding transcriptional repressor) of toxin-antitoxin stability system